MAKDWSRATSLPVQCSMIRDSEDRGQRSCPGCRTDLDLHQPALDHPGRLLGTCPGCGSWFIYDELDGGASLMVRVPAASEMVRLADGLAPRPRRSYASVAAESREVLPALLEFPRPADVIEA